MIKLLIIFAKMAGYIYLFMIDPGGPMIHHNMANIAITHISVQRCDFGAPDVAGYLMVVWRLSLKKTQNGYLC